MQLLDSFMKFPSSSCSAVYDSGNITSQGDWQVSGSGGTATFSDGINSASASDSENKIIYLDLQDSDLLDGENASETEWVLRWKMTWSNAPSDYGTPFMTLSSTTGAQNATQNYVCTRFDGASIGIKGTRSSTLAGGSTAKGSIDASYYTSNTFYFELKRDGSNCLMSNYNSDYSSVDWTSGDISLGGSGDMNLRYIKFVPRWAGGSGDYNATMDDFIFYNGCSP